MRHLTERARRYGGVTRVDRSLDEVDSEGASFVDNIASDAPGPDLIVEARERQRLARRLLNSLPVQQRRVLALNFGIADEMTVPEVARRMGRSPSWTFAQRRDALAALREIAARDRAFAGLRRGGR